LNFASFSSTSRDLAHRKVLLASSPTRSVLKPRPCAPPSRRGHAVETSSRSGNPSGQSASLASRSRMQVGYVLFSRPRRPFQTTGNFAFKVVGASGFVRKVPFDKLLKINSLSSLAHSQKSPETVKTSGVGTY